MEADREEQQRLVRNRPPAPGLVPWLVYVHGRRRERQTFFSLSEDQSLTRKIPEMRQKRIAACMHGWVVLVDSSWDNHPCDCFLLNPISMQKIQLPTLVPKFRNFVLSLAPDDPNCIAMVFYCFKAGEFRLLFCKPGADKWRSQEFTFRDEEYDMVDYPAGVGVYNGEIYMLSYCERLYMVNVNHANRVTLLDLKIDYESYLKSMTKRSCEQPIICLVETCDELLRVDLWFLDKDLVDIQVFKVDLENKEWIRIKRMNDLAIFIGFAGQIIACSTKETGMQGNAIYFTLPEDRSLYKYDLESGNLEAHLPCPDVKHKWSQPNWILPQLPRTSR